jgi:hypothetical protein
MTINSSRKVDMQTQQKIETITPRVAESMLANMVKNRPVSEAKVLEYAIAIDEWALNGETIKFDKAGRLFDGQHRLRACILAGKDFTTCVVRGIEDDHAFATVDVGKNRSHGDVFSIAGFANPKDAAAVANIVYLFKKGKLDWRGPTESRTSRGSSPISAKLKKMPHASAVVNKEDLLEFAESVSEGLASATRFAQTSKASKLISAPLIGGGYYLFREKSFNDAEAFFADLGEGVGLTKTDAVYWLRERLIDNKSSDAKLNRWTIIGLMFKAWNKRRAKEPVKQLRVQDGEEFPRKLA